MTSLPARLRMSADFSGTTNQPLARHLAVGLLALAVGYWFTGVVSSYSDVEIANVTLYAVAIAGLSVLVGRSGQISLGHGALMAVGGYTLAWLQTHEPHLSLLLMLLASAAAGGIAGLIVGLPASRLRGPYLAGLTLALALAVPDLTVKFQSVLGGEQGLSTLPPTPPGGVNPIRWLAVVSLITAVVVMVALANYGASPAGRSLRMVRDDDVAAALAGVNVARARIGAFGVSSACAGVAGGLLVLNTGISNPGEFPLTLSIELLAVMVLGGTGTLFGAWWAAILLVYIPDWAGSLAHAFGQPQGSPLGSNIALGFFGVVLITVTLAAPQGVQGGLRALRARGQRQLAGRRQ